MLDLRLYVSGDAPYSAAALQNLRSICDRYLTGRHTLEVVDVVDDPTRCLQDSIMATPTLVRLSPAPRIEITGDLADAEEVLSVLSGVLG